MDCGGTEILIGLDANDRSSLCHNNGKNEKKELMEGVRGENGVGRGKPAWLPPPTHEAGVNIDTTLTTEELSQRMVGCRVSLEDDLSDHRLILMGVRLGRGRKGDEGWMKRG